MFNAPVPDGSHLLKTWERVDSQGTQWELTELHGQVLDAIRSYEGRIQIYTCVFSHPAIELLGKVTCPVLGLCSEQDMLYSYLPRVKEAVSNLYDTVLNNANTKIIRNRMPQSQLFKEVIGRF